MKAVKLTPVDVHSSGDLVIEVGTAVVDLQPAGQPASQQAAKYLVVWSKTGSGGWQIIRDIWNNSPATK